MQRENVFLVIFFFAAVLSQQTQSAPPASPCSNQQHKQSSETANDRVLSECEYHSLDKRTLIDDILTACRRIVLVSSNIHHKLMGPNTLVRIRRRLVYSKLIIIIYRTCRITVLSSLVCAQWATVGVYNNAGVNSIAPSGHMLLYAVHYSVAASVSIFQSFLRPIGAALTEETLREVAQMERDTVRQELYDVYGSLATAATRAYQLVSFIQCYIVATHCYNNIITLYQQIENDINIHLCSVPHLPANTSVTLRPHHLQQVSQTFHTTVTFSIYQTGHYSKAQAHRGWTGK